MRVIIWGCGIIGKRVYRPLIDQYHMQIIAYTDSSIIDKKAEKVYNTPIIAPEEISRFEYDYVLIAVYSFEAIADIHERLLQMNIPDSKIRSIALERDFFDACMDQRRFWIQDFANFVYENKMEGQVAECGVFRGDLAKYLNKFFPDKKLYLFDTFEGFNEADIKYEIELNNGNFNESVLTDKNLFRCSNLEWIMRKMTYPNNIEIRKGYFPETTEGVKDTFVFVNLDMDIYLPMLAGLRFFWDKMVRGGCILLHDYFDPALPGVRKAVLDFEAESNVCLNKITIGDGRSIALLKW